MFLSRWFQIESLYKFNAKFSPVWEPRFFVYPGGRDAPRIAIAALEAEAFLVWPARGEAVREAASAAGSGLHKVRRRYRAAPPADGRRSLTAAGHCDAGRSTAGHAAG